ncbi:WhiB family transcriptional regulator [Streptomyces sp. NPDC018584]|uniref:WhiB family transcriptional regulator n=1 Tax=unclassified Streptomyces TaxID=2593676 RepID=UPI0037B903B9
MMTPATAHDALTDHPHYKYRGCAPDPVLPSRMAGNLDLPVDAHMPPTTDGGESQKARHAREKAAIEVCLNCPVMVACDRYANTLTEEGKLTEPEGIWGGRRALERHRAVIRSRIAAPASVRAPDAYLHSPQKTAVLEALAAVWDPHEVAGAAGLDVRTANWQRSSLVRLLGLPRAATRMELLQAAADRGLLDKDRIVADDGTVPAVAPPTRTPAKAHTIPAPHPPTTAGTGRAAAVSVRLRTPRRTRFTDIDGQLALWEAELADVHPLIPHAVHLEAAA